MALRAMLSARRRAVSPCYACNKAAGPRVGLLPRIPLTPAHLATLTRIVQAGTGTNGKAPTLALDMLVEEGIRV